MHWEVFLIYSNVVIHSIKAVFAFVLKILGSIRTQYILKYVFDHHPWLQLEGWSRGEVTTICFHHLPTKHKQLQVDSTLLYFFKFLGQILDLCSAMLPDTLIPLVSQCRSHLLRSTLLFLDTPSSRLWTSVVPKTPNNTLSLLHFSRLI